MITSRHHFPAHCAAVGDLTDQKMAKVAFCLAVSAFCWCHNICSPWFFKALEYSFPFHPHVSASACLSPALCPSLVFFFLLPLSTISPPILLCVEVSVMIFHLSRILSYLKSFHISLAFSPPPPSFFPYTFFYFFHFPPQLICYLLIIPSSSLPPLFILPSSWNAISQPLITLSNSSSPSCSLRFLADRWLIFGPAMLESLMLFLWYPHNHQTSASFSQSWEKVLLLRT